MKKRLAFLIAFSVVGILPVVAQAQRKSPLADAPAIRKRVELRSLRFEISGGAGTTLNQDFYHTVFADLKIGFHLTDWLSLSGFGALPVTTLDTGFHTRLTTSLEDPMGKIPSQPLPAEATASMSKIATIAGAQLEFAPFTGKYSLFGKLFAHYDFYAFVGPGALKFEPTDASMIAAPYSTAVEGWKVGANFGVGIHSYFNDFLALDLVLRDIYAPINPAGRDVNFDKTANDDDLSWGSTFMVSLNLVLYLPATADISL